MGVVYKLTDKIIQFIINQKKEDSLLSCRGLVVIVKKKFKITLSKSSINTIWKQAGLSGPVGRKARSFLKPPEVLKQEPIKLLETRPPEKLELPQLLAEKPASEQPVKEPEKAPEKPALIPEKEVQKPVLPEKKEPEIIENKPELLPKPLPVPVPEPIGIKEVKKEEPLFEEVQSAQLIEIKDDEIIENLGFFFLKLAEWQVSQSSILAETIKPYLTNYELQDLKAKSEILLFLVALGLNDLEAIRRYDNKDIWALNQINQKHSPESLVKFIQDFKSLKSLSLTLSMVASQAQAEVNFIKITLADNTALFLDSQLKTIWQDSDIPLAFSTTINKSRSYVDDIFQDNVQSVNIFTAPGYFAFSPVFYELIYACEDLPEKRMLRLTFHNQHKNEIGVSLKLPAAKRFFIMGIWPWQEETSRIIQEDVRIVKSFYLEDWEKEIYYSEIRANLPQYKLFQGLKIRAALIRDTGLSWPRMGIITNFPDERPIPEIISEYLLRWPNLDEGYQDFLKKSEKSMFMPSKPLSLQKPGASDESNVYTLSSIKVDLWQNLSLIVNNLSSFCQRYFFPAGYENMDFSTMKQRFYSLPGRLKMQNNRLFITLSLPPGYAFQKDLLYAVRRVNENDCTSPSGQKIQFKLA